MMGPVSRNLAWVVVAFLVGTPWARAQSARGAVEETNQSDPVGTLEILADAEGSVVRLDGTVVGQTGTGSLKVPGVKAGMHTVEVTATNQAPVSRTVTVNNASTTVLHFAVPRMPAPAPEVAPVKESTGPSLTAASTELGRSLASLPWSSLTVGVTVGLVLAAAVFLITTPADAPFLDDMGLEIATQQWRTVGFACAAVAVLTGLASVLILFLQLDPVQKLVGIGTSALGVKSDDAVK